MKDIHVKFIPHAEQRYNTSGDYWEGDTINFRVSETGSDEYDFLVLIHEMVEYFLCKQRDIPLEDIDKFDLDYEAQREKGDVSEPGNCIDAPYYDEHRFAENIERMVAHELGVDWFLYNDEIDNL